jgi:hypothetical protein
MTFSVTDKIYRNWFQFNLIQYIYDAVIGQTQKNFQL